MTRAFIIRPFGAKGGVNFDAIDEKLIQPALSQIGITGSTTTEIVEQGNIREDMFRLLVCADLVIADISIHNANVFYELGIRHGMRPNATFLLRANMDEYPFDLRTDRYLSYDQNDPASSVTALARALKATLDSSRIDSPVYQVLPNLKAPDATALQVVPSDFREAVERAFAADQRGDLRLLAHEARSFEWASEGLRMVGRAQFDLKSNPGARETFEMLRELRPGDTETDQRLATIYRRLGDFTRSSQAIQRVIASALADRGQRAEARALYGKIVTARWQANFDGRTGEDARTAALRAPELVEALNWYLDAFHQDLNRPHAGLAALGLLCLRNELAHGLPVAWAEQFDSDDDAARALVAGEAQFGATCKCVAVLAPVAPRGAATATGARCRCHGSDGASRGRLCVLYGTASQGRCPALPGRARRSADIAAGHRARATRSLLAAWGAHRLRGCIPCDACRADGGKTRRRPGG